MSEQTRCQERTEAKPLPCEECNGSGVRHATIGGDGYGDRCCALMDAEVECCFCDGSGLQPETEFEALS